jgi:putative transcriptional regulator
MPSFKGQFLIAAPDLHDPNFHRAVLLMLEHSPGGAAGVIINRPTSASLAKLAEDVLGETFDWDRPIHLGGPVPGPLLVLHSQQDVADHEILDDVFSTVDPDHLRDLIRRRPEQVLFLANYAGWGPGQLEAEMAEDTWYVLPASTAQIFGEKGEAFWRDLVKEYHSGRLVKALDLREVPEDPNLN